MCYDSLHTKYGYGCWHAALVTLGFHGNFINGYRVYINAFYKLAYGKYNASPADADDMIRAMCECSMLAPTKFRPDLERVPIIGLMNYSRQHIASLRDKPAVGHYVDWDYHVVVHIQPLIEQANDSKGYEPAIASRPPRPVIRPAAMPVPTVSSVMDMLK